MGLYDEMKPGRLRSISDEKIQSLIPEDVGEKGYGRDSLDPYVGGEHLRPRYFE